MKNKDTLIIALIDVPQDITTGDYFYRTYSPGMALAREEGVHVIALSNIHHAKLDIMERADIVVLNDICDPDLLPLIRKRKEKGLLTIFEIADDMNALQPWNPVYEFYQNRENISLIYRLARYCDGLQFSVNELMRLYGGLNDNNRVFANQILSPHPVEPRSFENELIIGWGGSHGHLEDIASISNQLIEWLLLKPDVKIHLMSSRPIWDLFKELPDNKKRYYPPGSLQDYYRFLASIHIGIAPIRDTPFNRCRSDVKFLEYAVSGVVPVLADLEPYRSSVVNGKTGFLYKNDSDLINILELLENNRQTLLNISGSASDYVNSQRLQLRHISERMAFYGYSARPLGQLKERHTDPAALFDRLCTIEGAVRHGRFLELSSSGFEKALYAGLALLQGGSERQSANDYFKRASELRPQNYLPFLYSSRISEDPVSVLAKAIKLAPLSIMANILMGEELARQGKVIETLNAFNNALSVFPGYEIPLIRAGRLLKDTGRHEQAEQLFKRASDLQITLSHNLP